jgi:hypothetical protein
MSSSGTISGTPTVSGTFPYTVTVKDSAGHTGTVNCSVTVTVPAPLTLACPPNSGKVGTAYSATLAAAGGSGSYTFSVSAGSLPPGLTLNPSTGVISGTPTYPGSFAFTLKVTDSLNNTAFSTCTQSCGSNQVNWAFTSPLGQLGTSQAYTANGITITAYGFTNANAPKALYGRNDAGDEYGLGIAGTSENEIDNANYIQLDLANVIAAGATNPQMIIASVQAGETYNVYGSNTLGSIGTLLLANQTADVTPFAIPSFPAYRYVAVRAVINNVLIGAVSFSVGTCNINIAASGPTPVSLASFYNDNGIYADGVPFSDGGLDNYGNAYSGNLLGTSATWNSTPFNFGPTVGFDVVKALGAVVPLPAASFSAVRILATGINGNHAGDTLSVTYTDGTSTTFTQGFSDWLSPQNYSGESKALTMAYRTTSSGAKNNSTVYVYGYSFALNTAKTVASITLPNTQYVEVLAITLVP